MSARKPRSDSKLDALTQEQQEMVAEWCEQPKSEDSPGGLKYAQEQIYKEWLLHVSRSSLSLWYRRWEIQQDFIGAEDFRLTVEKMVRTEFPDLTPEQVASVGQMAFTTRAMAKGDSEEFRNLETLRLMKEVAMTKARQKDADLLLASRRVAVLEQKMAQAKSKLEAVVKKGGLTAKTLKEIEEAAKLL